MLHAWSELANLALVLLPATVTLQRLAIRVSLDTCEAHSVSLCNEGLVHTCVRLTGASTQ